MAPIFKFLFHVIFTVFITFGLLTASVYASPHFCWGVLRALKAPDIVSPGAVTQQTLNSGDEWAKSLEQPLVFLKGNQDDEIFEGVTSSAQVEFWYTNLRIREPKVQTEVFERVKKKLISGRGIVVSTEGNENIQALWAGARTSWEAVNIQGQSVRPSRERARINDQRLEAFSRKMLIPAVGVFALDMITSFLLYAHIIPPKLGIPVVSASLAGLAGFAGWEAWRYYQGRFTDRINTSVHEDLLVENFLSRPTDRVGEEWSDQRALFYADDSGKFPWMMVVRQQGPDSAGPMLKIWMKEGVAK